MNQQLLKRHLTKAKIKISNMIVKGLINSVDDTNAIQLLKVIGANNAVLSNITNLQTYGLTTVPEKNGEVLLGLVNGDKEQLIALAVNNSATRPTGYKEKDVVLYAAHGHKIELIEDELNITDSNGNTIALSETGVVINDHLEVLK